MNIEAWLRGPINGIPPFLMPVAHSLTQAREDLRAAVSVVSEADVWHAPGGAASIGFHLRHIAGSGDRLLTYAQDRALSGEQVTALEAEREPPESCPTTAELLAAIDDMIERVLDLLRGTTGEELLAPRGVGRAQLPSTVIGLLFHIAEHTQRHTGQVITTAKIVRRPGASV